MKRIGYIALFAATVFSAACVKEETKEDFFNIDETDVILTDYNSGSQDILLATNTEPTATLDGTAEWLSAEITPRCLTLTYKENTAEEDRTAKIKVVAGSILATVTVTQPGHKTEPEPEPEPEPLYKIYDVWYQNGIAAGIVFWAAEDGQSALVVSLDRTATTVAWSKDGSHAIGTGESDGAANTALLRASEEAASIPALEFCDAHGEGWFWPAMNEMKLLFEAYNGTAFDAATVAIPASITQEEKDARAAFEKVLADNGGTALNTGSENSNGDQYWTSTEQTDENTGKVYGSTMRFGKVYASTPADQMGKTGDTKRYVRCMKYVSGEPGGGPLQTKFQVYKENGKNVGIIYWTSEDGKTSKVLSLIRSEDVPWSSAAAPAFLNAISADDGAANTAAIKASAEANEIPAIAFCSSLGEEWYWPSLDELVEIFNVYNGVAYNPDEKSKVPAEISDEEKEARAAFDLSLITYGGTVMNTAAESQNGDRYWASTELQDAKGSAYGSFMRFGKAYKSTVADTPGKGKSGDGRFVRCIRTINND